MKEIKREKIPEIKAQPGDSITLSYSQDITDEMGKVLEQNTEEVLEAEIKEEYNFDEAVIFKVEKGDFKKVKRGLGGAFLESSK